MTLPDTIPYPVAVIGDVHGNSARLDELLDGVDAVRPGCHLSFVGDFVDRGPDSRGSVERVMGLVASGRAVAVCGNHDFALVRACGFDGHPPSRWWAERYASLYNAHSTFRSYGGHRHAAHPDDLVGGLTVAVPASHREFLAALPWCACVGGWDSTGGHLVVHSGLSRRLRLTAAEQVSALRRREWAANMGATPRDVTSFRDDYPVWLGADRKAAHDPLPYPGWVQVVGHEFSRAPANLGHAVRIDVTGGSPTKPLAAVILDAPGCAPLFVVGGVMTGGAGAAGCVGRTGVSGV